jgi:hypothetical protein
MTVFKRRFNYQRFITSIALGMMLSAATIGFAQTTSSQLGHLCSPRLNRNATVSVMRNRAQGGGSGSLRFHTA